MFETAVQFAALSLPTVRLLSVRRFFSIKEFYAMTTHFDISRAVPFATCFSVGAVLFSSHAGGGFASGNQAYQNFVSSGWLGPFSAVLCMLIFTLTIKEAMFMYNSRKMTSYKQLFETLFHPFDKIEILFEVFFYIVGLMAVGAAVATAASTINAYFPFGNSSYYVYIGVVGFVVLIFTIFGADIVRRASTVMGLGILTTSIAIFATGIVKAPDLSGVIAASYAADGFSKLPQAVMTAFTYAGFQCVVIPTMIVCGAPLMNRRACAKSMWISFGLNAVALVLSVFMLIGWAPFFTSVPKGTTIPTLTSCREMGIGILTAVYTVCLLLCLISTGVTTVFGFTARFEKLRIFSGIKSAPVRCAIVSAAIIVLAMGVSMAGLTNIIKYGYGYCGYLAIAIIIVPFLTVGVFKNRAFVKAHPEYQGVPAAHADRSAAPPEVPAVSGD